MCKKFFNSLLGGDGMPTPGTAQEGAATTQAAVKNTSTPQEASAAGGSYVPQERRRGRLAGLGL